MTRCRTPGCRRQRRPDSPWCPACFDAIVTGRAEVTTPTPSAPQRGSTGLLRPIYRLRSRGRIEVLTPRGNWMRRGLIPADGIRVHAPLTESERRWLFGDR